MRLLARTIALVVIVGLVAFWQRAALVGWVLPTIAQKALTRDTKATLADGLHVVLCGAGGPLYDPVRSAPCTLVIAGDTTVLIDAGTAAARNMGRLGFSTGAIDLALITHFHSDHIDGLGELAMVRWVQEANDKPLPVIGPEGITEVVAGFNVAYEQDQVYRHAHHGDDVAPPSGAGMTATLFTAPPEGIARDVFQRGDLRIEMFAVDHHPVHPAVGYRMYYKDRSLVISGDTRRSGNLLSMSRDTDLLVHEALSPALVTNMHNAAVATGNRVLAKITADIPDYHTAPVEAAAIAREAGVKHLLFYHVVPALPLPGMDQIFLEGVVDIFAETTLGRDGTMVSLPADSDAVQVRELL